MISGCIGQIHLPASVSSRTTPLPAIRGRTAARTNMPGFSRPAWLSAITRTCTVRVSRLITGLMNEIVPSKTSPGTDSVVNVTSWPYRSHGSCDS